MTTVRFGPLLVDAIRCRGLLQKQPAHESKTSANSVGNACRGRPVRIDVARRIVLALSRIEPIEGLDAWMIHEADRGDL